MSVYVWLRSVWQSLCPFMSLKMALFYSFLWLRPHCINCATSFFIYSSILTYYTLCIYISHLWILQNFLFYFSHCISSLFLWVTTNLVTWNNTDLLSYNFSGSGVQFPVKPMVVCLSPWFLAGCQLLETIGPWPTHRSSLNTGEHLSDSRLLKGSPD